MGGDKDDNADQRVKGVLITPTSRKEKYGLTMVRLASADIHTVQSTVFLYDLQPGHLRTSQK